MSEEIKKDWFVWNEEAEEGVVLCDRNDVEFAATGRQISMGVSCVADRWRELYAEDEPEIEFPVVEGQIINGTFIRLAS